jgi:hypothetical protein
MKLYNSMMIVLLGACLVCVSGCVSGDIEKNGLTDRYQSLLVEQGTLQREAPFDANEPNDVGLIRPVGRSAVRPSCPDPNLFTMDGSKTLRLSLREAIHAVLINSPEVRVISYDPALAEEEIRKLTIY